jgi:hypothetical protein
VRQKQVIGLEIAVDDSLMVGFDQHAEQVVGVLHHLVARELAAESQPALLERLALEQLHYQECGTIVGDVVVLDSDRVLVPHLVGDVALAQESLAHGAAHRQVGVEHLDGDLVAVAMGRAIHRSHAPTAKQRI